MMYLNNILEFKQWFSETEAVYLYGAGNVCRKILSMVEYLKCVDKVKGILVSDMTGNAETINSITIREFSKSDMDSDAPIILAVSGRYRDEICGWLQEQDVQQIVFLPDDFEKQLDEEIKRREISDLKEKLVSYSKNADVKKTTDILLLTPPYWDAYSPFSAVPCLTAVLREKGFLVDQFDVGIHTIHHIINTRWQEAARYCLSEFFYNNYIKIYDQNMYQSLEEYRNDMWFFCDNSFDVELIKSKYNELNVVQRGVIDSFITQIIALNMPNINFDNCDDLTRCVDEWDSRHMLRSIYNAEGDIKEMLANIPEVVGISITGTWQFVPGCVLAELIRECRPDVRIILGGSCADLFANSSYVRKTDIKRYFDYIIIGEGETAIVNLMQYLRGEMEFDDIPNLMIIDSDTQIRFAKQIVEDVNSLPAPDYDGLNLDLYLAPQLVLPYQASRGCHYGYCAFCNHDKKYRHNYRTKQVDRVIKDLLLLSHKYKNKYFQFVDEAIRPDSFRDMIEEMDKYPEFKEMKWFYYSRVSRAYDEELLVKAHRNGCEMVMFGVESFNQRLLNFIKKGISAEVSKYCLELFHKCGIKTYAWLLCNLPSETLEEAREDLEEVKRMAEHIDAFSVAPFSLVRNTDMYNDLEKYNIISVDSNDPTRFQSHKDGVIIDKDSMLSFCWDEYVKYSFKLFSVGNRYTLFFK